MDASSESTTSNPFRVHEVPELEQERDDTCDRGAFRETVPSLRATISSDADDR